MEQHKLLQFRVQVFEKGWGPPEVQSPRDSASAKALPEAESEPGFSQCPGSPSC